MPSIKRSSSNIRISCNRTSRRSRIIGIRSRPMQNQTAHYEDLRARFAAERAAYHRDLWPNDYRTWELRPDFAVMHARVEITNGDHVGTVTGIARGPGGRIEGLEVALDSGKVVWIDAADVRFNRANGIVMTDLNRADLHQMADERF